ncbi:MAG: hypothetical protein WKG07_02215 [Hymenobacter sp.]
MTTEADLMPQFNTQRKGITHVAEADALFGGRFGGGVHFLDRRQLPQISTRAYMLLPKAR